MSYFLVYIYNSANKNMYKVQNEYRGRWAFFVVKGLGMASQKMMSKRVLNVE